MPAKEALSIHLLTSLPSGEVSRPILIEENGQMCYHKSSLSFISIIIIIVQNKYSSIFDVRHSWRIFLYSLQYFFKKVISVFIILTFTDFALFT